MALTVELAGMVDEDTGFVVNVIQIDKAVRDRVAGWFSEQIRSSYRACRHVSTVDLVGILQASWRILNGCFGQAAISRLGLALNPTRRIAIDSEDSEMFLFSEKFEFAAMHKLWNESFSPERNFEVFGKCANPTGHGHNYVLEVTVSCPRSGGIRVGQFEQVISEHFIELVDHKNLNADVAEFKEVIPTVENIAKAAWQRLNGRFGEAKLESVTVWETDKTYCSYRQES